MKASVISALLLASGASAFIQPSPLAVPRARVSARRGPVMENFNLPIGEDQAENVPVAILGEANYRKFVSSYNPDGLIVGGPSYPLFKRISELKLLSLTADSGLLSRLEELGLKLSDLEKLLPIAEELNLLGLAEANKDLILKTLAPLAVEQAPLLLPLLVATLKAPPALFYGVAATALAAEVGVHVTFDNIALDVIAGIPLVGLAAVSAVAGSVLGSGIKIPAPARKPTVASVSAAATSRPKIAIKASAPKASPVKVSAPKAAAPKVSAVKVSVPKAVVKAPLVSAPRPVATGPLIAAPAAAKPTIPKIAVKAAPAAPKPAPKAAPIKASPPKAAAPIKASPPKAAAPIKASPPKAAAPVKASPPKAAAPVKVSPPKAAPKAAPAAPKAAPKPPAPKVVAAPKPAAPKPAPVAKPVAAPKPAAKPILASQPKSKGNLANIPRK